MGDANLRIESDQVARAALDLGYGSRLLYSECVEPALAVLLPEFSAQAITSIRGLLDRIRQVEHTSSDDEQRYLVVSDFFAEKTALQMILDQAMKLSRYTKWYSLGVAIAHCHLVCLGKADTDRQAWVALFEGCQQLTEEDLARIPPCRMLLERWSPTVNPDKTIAAIFEEYVKADEAKELASIPWRYDVEKLYASVSHCLRRLPPPPDTPETPAQRRNRLAYEKRIENLTYKEIMVFLNQHAADQGWGRLATPNGVKAAIARHATQNRLPLPQEGKPGRPGRNEK
jgi:hypothetical protein